VDVRAAQAEREVQAMIRDSQGPTAAQVRPELKGLRATSSRERGPFPAAFGRRSALEEARPVEVVVAAEVEGVAVDEAIRSWS
jgi:hypothetical protein